MRNEDFKLCYVNGDWAYFTTQDVTKQWGDDWNDAPYEHNAGSPYTWQEYMTEHGIEPYELKIVAFTGPFNQPSSNYYNSPYSVEMINAGAVAWLYTDKSAKEKIIIPAGTTLPEFIRLVKQAGGDIFMPVSEL